MTLIRFLLLPALLAVAAIAPAAAQTAPPASCDSGSNFDDDPIGISCAAASINRQILITNAGALSRAVAGSFGIGPAGIEPAGLGDITAAEAMARLAGEADIVVAPTADAPAAAAPTPKWNFWVDGKYTWNDNSNENFDLDGPLYNGLMGLDYKVTDKVLVGLIGTYESSSLDGSVVETESDGWGFGPYIGVFITDNIVFSANMLGTWLDSSQSGMFEFESERLQAAAAINGYWYKDTWRFTPGVSLSWSKEWIDGTSGTSSHQTVETGLLTPSVQFGNTLRMSETATVEPWAGAALDWAFINSIDTDSGPSIDDPNVDLRLQAGLNFGFGSNMQLSLTGEAGGLILDTIDTYSVEANLAVQF